MRIKAASVPAFAIAIALAPALAVVLAPASAEAGQQLLVVSVRGAELSPGQVLDGAAQIDLPPGSQVKLIGTNGASVTLTGPYSGKPAPEEAPRQDQALLSALSRLVSADRVDSGSLGAIRSASATAAVTAADTWRIDSGRSATYCIAQDRPATIWRATAKGASRAILHRLDTGASAEVRWADGEQQARWPDALGAPTEGRYLLRDGFAGGKDTQVSLRQVPADLPNDVHRAAWMGENGCAPQARRLLQALP